VCMSIVVIAVQFAGARQFQSPCLTYDKRDYS